MESDFICRFNLMLFNRIRTISPCQRVMKWSCWNRLLGMTLVPFAEDLNRFVLRATGQLSGAYRVTWGDASREYSAEELARGVQLPVDFPENPFCEAFDRVDAAVAAKQAFETTQVKKVFHGRQGQTDFEKAVAETEAQRAPLAAAIARAMTPVTHTITITH